MLYAYVAFSTSEGFVVGMEVHDLSQTNAPSFDRTITNDRDALREACSALLSAQL